MAFLSTCVELLSHFRNLFTPSSSVFTKPIISLKNPCPSFSYYFSSVIEWCTERVLLHFPFIFGVCKTQTGIPIRDVLHFFECKRERDLFSFSKKMKIQTKRNEFKKVKSKMKLRAFLSRLLNAINLIFQQLNPKKHSPSKLVNAIKFTILLQCTLIFESALQLYYKIKLVFYSPTAFSFLTLSSLTSFISLLCSLFSLRGSWSVVLVAGLCTSPINNSLSTARCQHVADLSTLSHSISLLFGRNVAGDG